VQAKMNLLKVGDTISKDFFKCLRPPIHATQFHPIQVEGVRFTSLLDIINTFMAHYEQFFFSQPLTNAKKK